MTVLFLTLLFFLLFVVGWAILVVFLAITSILCKGRWKQVSIMWLIWSTIPLLLPRYAKRKQLITSLAGRWAFAFFSPYTIVVLIFVFGFLGMDLPSKCSMLGKEGASISTKVISWSTGVDFPKLDYIDGKYSDNFPDYSTECTMKVKGTVPKEFVEELKESDKWRKEEYKYVYVNQKGHDELAPMTTVEVDTNSGLVRMSYIKF